MSGYFGIGIINGKHRKNIGTLLRSSHQLGAAFVFTVGNRYARQASDTSKTWRCIPLFHFADIDTLLHTKLFSCKFIGVEFTDDAISLPTYKHPPRAVYLLGAEDGGLPRKVLDICHEVIEIPSVRLQSYNVSTAGAIVMYDRLAKQQSEDNA